MTNETTQTDKVTVPFILITTVKSANKCCYDMNLYLSPVNSAARSTERQTFGQTSAEVAPTVLQCTSHDPQKSMFAVETMIQIQMIAWANGNYLYW